MTTNNSSNEYQVWTSSTTSNKLNSVLENYYATATNTTGNYYTNYYYTTTTNNSFVYSNEYIYDGVFIPDYYDDTEGLRCYVMDVKNKIFAIVDSKNNNFESVQDFQDNLYSIMLDTIYTIAESQSSCFNDILDESKYDYNDLNSIVTELIRKYRSYCNRIEEDD